MLRLPHLRRLAAAVLLLCAPAACVAPSFAHAADGRAAVTRAAARHHVPRRLALAVMATESSGRCSASSGIAHGVMQVRPGTAAMVGIRGDLFNCETGAEAGVRYLARCLRAAHGRWAIAAHFYNAGTGARARISRYAALVMSRAAR